MTVRRGPRERLTRAIALLSASCLLAAGCGLFEPRHPADPINSATVYPPQTTAERVITNLQTAISVKDVLHYANCFSNTASPGAALFVFVPSAEGLKKYGTLLSAWGYAEETAYFQNLTSYLPATAPSGLALSLPPKFFDAKSDSVTYEYDYTLSIEHTQAAFPKIARGTLRFTLTHDNANNWTISRWSDFNNTTGDISWSSVKGNFAQ